MSETYNFPPLEGFLLNFNRAASSSFDTILQRYTPEEKADVRARLLNAAKNTQDGSVSTWLKDGDFVEIIFVNGYITQCNYLPSEPLISDSPTNPLPKVDYPTPFAETPETTGSKVRIFFPSGSGFYYNCNIFYEGKKLIISGPSRQPVGRAAKIVKFFFTDQSRCRWWDANELIEALNAIKEHTPSSIESLNHGADEPIKRITELVGAINALKRRLKIGGLEEKIIVQDQQTGAGREKKLQFNIIFQDVEETLENR